MLSHVSIENIVLIERQNLELGSGLCVLSGETGAGKSILLDALGLVLGGRSEARLIRKGTDKAQVTATFDLDDRAEITSMLDELGIEPDDLLILRRQMSADGKSRAFINDQPVSAKALKSLGELLVEVHGQHQQRGLLDPATHRVLLDAYGKHGSLSKTAKAYKSYKAAGDALATLEAELEQTVKEADYLEHMLAELKQLNPQIGEEEELSDMRQLMMQSEKLASTLNDALQALLGANPVREGLRSAQGVLTRSTLTAAEQFSPAIDALEEAMDAVSRAEDAIEALGQNCEYNQSELETVEERLFALKAAGRKYQISIEDLPNLYVDVQQKLRALSEQQTRREALAKEVAEAKETYVAAAEALRKERSKTAKKLESALHAELASLKMGATLFQVEMTEKDEAQWSEHGMDQIQFVAATNKGAQAGPLQQIASGGELSRFMLALAVVLADTQATPVMIFDEIDTGTGGAVADAIGKRLEALGQHAQVLVVTHLPQVAARGDQHLFVEKAEKKGETITSVRVLQDAERQEEIARMMSGAEVNEDARKAARQLLKEAV